MRPAPEQFERLPEQYFTALLARVAAAAASEGERVIDLGRGNPDLPPPPHVAERLAAAAASRDAAVHGYAPFSGLPELKDAVAHRYRTVYGVDLDPQREVAIVPGIKSTLAEFPLCVVERGSTLLLPDPGYPDYLSGAAFADARVVPFPIEPTPDFDSMPADAAALYLNYPSNPTGLAAAEGVFAAAVRFAERTGATVLHDFAYGDLVFDGRRPASFLSEPGAKEVGIELFAMSKTYGMAGWRLGFAVGNAEIVRRLDVMQSHLRAGIFAPLQEAAIAALLGPQDTVEERRAIYEARRDRVVAALPGARSEGTFFAWLRLPAGLTAERILEEARVAVAPGEGFGSRGAGYARISLAVSDDLLDEGIERLGKLFG
ncbi:MAG TPA: aminotransferase class I/II-fold pyridoxal phosphate-dependent enzyme [Gaiellaceae bacterium]|nr:aminotransferase class I/II-fold pyridoxal phosphate-dependent enzyme [Gaiellaceae bacterium]